MTHAEPSPLLHEVLRYAPLSGVALQEAFIVAPGSLAYNDHITDPESVKWLLERLDKFSAFEAGDIVHHAMSRLDPADVTAFAAKEKRVAVHVAAWPHYTSDQRARAITKTGYKTDIIKRAFADGTAVADEVIVAALPEFVGYSGDHSFADVKHFPAAHLAAVSPDCAPDVAAAAFLSVTESKHVRHASYRSARLACSMLLERPAVFEHLLATTWKSRIPNSSELVILAFLNVQEPYATNANDLMAAALAEYPFSQRAQVDPYDLKIIQWPIMMWPRNDAGLVDTVLAALDSDTMHHSMLQASFLRDLRPQMYRRLMTRTPLSRTEPGGGPDPLASDYWPFYPKFRKHLASDVSLTPEGWQELMGWMRVLQASIPSDPNSASHILKRALLPTVFNIVAPVFEDPAALAYQLAYGVHQSGLRRSDTPAPLFQQMFDDLGAEMPKEPSRAPSRFAAPAYITTAFAAASAQFGDSHSDWATFFALLNAGLSLQDAVLVAAD